MGETSKNVAAVFRKSREESNSVVNVLLQELDGYTGIVIFATNLAANLDPAFERRIRTHVLFELPSEPERVRIWRVQLHPSRTPLAPDVDFNALAHRYEVSGGDIQNAVLKAALAAAAEPVPNDSKRIHQRHFQAGIEQVMASKRVMQQSIFAEATVGVPGPKSSVQQPRRKPALVDLTFPGRRCSSR